MTFNLYNKGKIMQDLKYKETRLYNPKNPEVMDLKRSYMELQNRLRKLNNLFHTKDKNSNSIYRNSLTFSKQPSQENLVKKYKSGKNSPKKLDFDSYFDSLESKLGSIKKNFNSKEKSLRYEVYPKKANNTKFVERSDSSDVNLDEITDSIVCLTNSYSEHNRTNENSKPKQKSNQLYIDIDMACSKKCYLNSEDKDSILTPKTNGTRFLNIMKDKGIINESHNPISKISSSLTDYVIEKRPLPEIKLNSTNDFDNNLNTIKNILPDNNSKTNNPNQNVYRISQNIFNNINCYPDKKEKTPIKFSKSNDFNTEMEDVDFEVSELTSHQRADDSYEITRKKSLRSTRKFKRDSLVIQVENNINIIGIKDCNSTIDLKNVDKSKEIPNNSHIIQYLNQLEIEGKKEIVKLCNEQINNEIKIDRVLMNEFIEASDKNKEETYNSPIRNLKENEENNENFYIEIEEESEYHENSFEIANENNDLTNLTIPTNDKKKKVNFRPKTTVIDLEDNKCLVTSKTLSCTENNIKSHNKSRNKKKIKPILKRPKDLKEDEDPFMKLNDLIKECEIEESKTNTPQDTEIKKYLVQKNIKYIDELKKKNNKVKEDDCKKELVNHSTDAKNNNTTLPSQIEESRFENLTPHKKEILLKNCILKVNLESSLKNLENDSNKILEEEFENLSLVSIDKISKQQSSSTIKQDEEIIKKSSSNPNICKKKTTSKNNNNKTGMKITKSNSSRAFKIVKKPPTPFPNKTSLPKKKNK